MQDGGVCAGKGVCGGRGVSVCSGCLRPTHHHPASCFRWQRMWTGKG